MEFDKSRVYTALNADKLKVGSKVAVADDLSHLKSFVKTEVFRTLENVCDEGNTFRFVANGGLLFSLAYLVSEPEEKIDEEMAKGTVEIDNPCYHCYTGAIGECFGIGCKYVSYPWSGDLEADYKVEVEKGGVSK